MKLIGCSRILNSRPPTDAHVRRCLRMAKEQIPLPLRGERECRVQRCIVTAKRVCDLQWNGQNRRPVWFFAIVSECKIGAKYKLGKAQPYEHYK